MKLTDELRNSLLETSREVRRYAYVPYSNYHVGAALLTSSGKIYDGVNIENVSYGATVCAERVVTFKAVSEGEREFAALAVATATGGFPCGLCRQVLAEFGPDMIILATNEDGSRVEEALLSDLLPGAFTPTVLSEATS